MALELEVSHRNSPWRVAQKLLEGPLSIIIVYGENYLQFLQETQIEEVIQAGVRPIPNNLTYTGQELMLQAADDILAFGPTTLSGLHWYLGLQMDGLDGPWARYFHLDSPEGAINDVSVDRITEMALAYLIEKNRQIYPDFPQNLSSKLITSFQFSTLIKAASVMCGVGAQEGKVGGMGQRRKLLFTTLNDLGVINILPKASFLLLTQKQFLRRIDNRLQFLIDQGWSRARERTATIAKSTSYLENGWFNPRLYNPNSSAAKEARKYVAILELCQSQGFNLLDILNSLSTEVKYPSTEFLYQTYPQIFESLPKAQTFVLSALEQAKLPTVISYLPSTPGVY